jgi:DNA polymerase III subunit epsilon
VILFFDTETDGLVKRDLPHDHPWQPFLLQLGAVLCEEDGTERAAIELLVASTQAVPSTATKVHGITPDILRRGGVRPEVACAMFANLARMANRVAAYQLDFDERVMSAAFARIGRVMDLPMERVCVAETAERVFKMPPTARMMETGYGDKNKKPSLSEAYMMAFAEDLVGAHSALVDARAAARLHLHMAAGRVRAPIVKRIWRSLWQS